MKIMRMLLTLLRNVLLEMQSKILLYTHTQKKNIFLWKIVSLFWTDFTSVLSILQKSKVANNLITILGYSNDKNIYIYCKEYYFDWLVNSLYKIQHVQPTGFNT